jgi:hypothetical protein
MLSVNITRKLALILLIGLGAEVERDGFAAPAELGPPASSDKHPVAPCFVWLDQRRVRFDLANRADLQRLEVSVRLELDRPGDAANRPTFDKRFRRGLREIQRLTEMLLNCKEAQEARRLQMMLAEAAAAADNLRQAPLPGTIDFLQVPLAFLERLSRPVGQGHTVAGNLQPGDHADSSWSDPEPSTFWRRPQSIAGRELYHGFGRSHLLLESEPLCTYAGPKESYGRNPGFDIECEGVKLKVKFAEVSSEPFATRIFDALGYHTDPTDYAARVKVRYSRRIFAEFNSRKPLQTHFTLLGFLTVYTLDLQQHYDPFAYVSTAVLADGRRWSGAELKRRLLRNPSLPLAETEASNYRPEIESAIDYLETVPANVQERVGKSIGPWDFGQLDHPSRRELRGAGLLAAWLGWFDTRPDNTRLRIVQRDGRCELEHYFSDLGGVLGETTGILYARGELPNAFPWTFTRPPLWQGEHRLARPFRLTGYKPVVRTPAFAAMTLDDARWMARLIGALSEEQIEQALIGSGYDSAQVRLYLAKLLSRRDQMIIDLGLANEIRLTESAKNRRFSYNPVTDGALRVQIEGTLVEAPAGMHRIVNGKLLLTTSQLGSAPRVQASAPNAFSF